MIVRIKRSFYMLLFFMIVFVVHCVKSIQIRTSKNSVFGHFSRSGLHYPGLIILVIFTKNANENVMLC